MEQVVKLAEMKYNCPRCRLNSFHELLDECIICEPNHIHLRCLSCGIEWVETIDKSQLTNDRTWSIVSPMEKLSKYKLVNVNTNKKMKPGFRELTLKEVSIINYALALNQTNLKYVKVWKQETGSYQIQVVRHSWWITRWILVLPSQHWLRIKLNY